jgi:ABC-type transport system involved in cytochrome c biogenesis permease subunit
MIAADTSHPSKRARRFRPLVALANLFNSIWLGIFWIAAILVYSALGSAIPEFRQQFELTEFHFFNHWFFVALIALLCVNLTVATVRRIPVNIKNAGVLTVHAGILILCAGSVVYFGRKIEGEVWLDAPKISIVSTDRLRANPENPEAAVLESIIAVPGNKWEQNIPMLGGKHSIEVTKVEHRGLTTAAEVELAGRIGEGEPILVKLDQAEKKNRIDKLGDRLALWLRPANECQTFYDESTPCLFVKYKDHVETFELPDVPYYHERFVPDVETITDTAGKPVQSSRWRSQYPLENWRIPIPLGNPNSASASDWPISIEIDGYLPYATMRSEPTTGGEQVMPIAKVSLVSGGAAIDDWLVASMPERTMIESADSRSAVEFRWLDDQAEIPVELTQSIDGQHVIDVHVKDKSIKRRYVVEAGQKIAVEGTDYSLTIEELRPSWPLMTAGFQGARTPIALVWVKSPKQEFQRSVLMRYAQLDQDRDRAGKKINPDANLVDENIDMTYVDASRDHLTLFAGTSLPPTLVHTAPGGKRSVQKLDINKPFDAGGGVSLTLTQFIIKPSFDRKPVVIPAIDRRPFGSVRRGNSLVRVHLRSKNGDWSRRIWVPFSMFNTDHLAELDQHEATVVKSIPGMGDIALVYGRTERALPGRICLEHMKTDFYPGRQQPSEWTSFYRYEDPETRQINRGKVHLNNTANFGEWTLFQSQAAADHKSWTILGVGNRRGVLTMLAGCILISLGMGFAFFIKPVIVRRRRELAARMNQRIEEEDEPSHMPRRSKQLVGLIALALMSFPSLAAAQSPIVQNPAAGLRDFVEKVDIERLGRLSLQHQWRYSTVDSWARDAIKSMHGAGKLFEIDPVAAAVEMMFNADAYHSESIIYVKDKAIIGELTAFPVVVTPEERRRMYTSGLVSYDFLSSPEVAKRLGELNSNMLKKTAMDRLSNAIGYYESLANTFTIVPDPKGAADTPWYSPRALERPELAESFSLSAEQRGKLAGLMADWKAGWLARDATRANAAIAGLDELLPTLAPAGVYPPMEKRAAEVRYRRMGMLRYAWGVYIAAFFTSIFAVGTRFRWVRTLGLVLLITAIGLHAYDIGMRWYVIGRIPVANMFEAVVSSTWIGAVFGLLLELFQKKRVYLLSASLLGFFALALPELLPNQLDNKLVTMMPILDDIMLRIHTVLIIASYAVITLAYGVANCYLFVSAFRDKRSVAQATIGAQLGAVLWLVLARLDYFAESTTQLVIVAAALSIVGGALMFTGGCSLLLRRRADSLDPADFPIQKGLLEEFDLSHRVLLYTAMIALFVGLVLGAIWADYSWGRPWGWDPKEVFALETWLVYALLIHTRFVTRQRALWTSVLSVFGFAAMQFNWWVVNFYIVGLHSYA